MIISGTGHRPFQFDKKTQKWISKLEYANDSGVLVAGNSRDLYNRLVDLACAWLRKHPEVTDVIQGCAMGWDLALGRAAVLEGRKMYAYVPYPGHGSEWKTFYKQEHESILGIADKVFVPDKKPNPDEFAKFLLQRNKDMVDASDFTLALWDGSWGGTAHCVNYAQEKRGDAWGENLWPMWEKYRGRVYV